MNRQSILFQDPKEHKLFDLFGFGSIDYYPSFFEPSESDRYLNTLLNKIAWRQDKINIIGKKVDLPRLTAWYGDEGFNYTYSGIKMDPLPWNDDLLKIKELIEPIAKVSFSSVLLNLYRYGNDSVSWHADDEKGHGDNRRPWQRRQQADRTSSPKVKEAKGRKKIAHACSSEIIAGHSFLNISSATCSRPRGTITRNGTCSPQSKMSPTGII